MSTAVAGSPRVLHASPGRLRLHLSEPADAAAGEVAEYLGRLAGVDDVTLNPLTGNALLRFDPGVTTQRTIVAALHAFKSAQTPTAVTAAAERARPRPAVRVTRLPTSEGRRVRARIPIPGLDRNPELGRRVRERLERRPGVHVTISMLTGRVLVEYEEHEAEIDDLVAELVGMDLPDLPEGDEPSDPFSRGRVIQTSARTVGASLGLVLVGVRQLLGTQRLESGVAVRANVIVGVLIGFPIIRRSLRRWFGRDVGDLLMSLPSIVTLALSGNWLGLLVSGVEGMRALTEVTARQSALKRLLADQEDAPSAQAGARIHLETGERTPLAGRVLGGTGTAIGRDGLPRPVRPGEIVAAGARLNGGPFTLELETAQAFGPQVRPAPAAPDMYDRYIQIAAPLSLLYAAIKGILSRSVTGALEGLLLLTPRPAVIGMEAANLEAATRTLRGGAVIVGTRPERIIRRPDLLLLDSPRLLVHGFELAGVIPLAESVEVADLVERAALVAAAAGSPWGDVLRALDTSGASDATFDGRIARARIAGIEYALGALDDDQVVPAAARAPLRGAYLLALQRERDPRPLGILALRPRLVPGIAELVRACQQHGVALAMLTAGDPAAARAVADRARVPLLPEHDAGLVIRAQQALGKRVAFVADNAHAAQAFAACDLAIGLTDHHTHLPARADLIAADLEGLTAIIIAGARRDVAVLGAVALSALANAAGAYLGLRSQVGGLANASRIVYGTALGALALDWLAERGGARPRALLATVLDPHPEQWGRRSIATTLRTLGASAEGLSSSQAASRRHALVPRQRERLLLRSLLDQLTSPVTLLLAAGAGLSLVSGGVGNAVIITATISANTLIGTWQEHRADQAARALDSISAPFAHVLRDGKVVRVPATRIVVGDILVLASGDRVAADARLIASQALETDEAALTGESLPIHKAPDGPTDASRIVLEGSDVTTGSGRAVVVAVGRFTRMGATAMAMAEVGNERSPLGMRLSRLLSLAVPVSLAAGVIVIGAGLVRGQPLLSRLELGASIALAAVPEGLPLLAKLGEAAVGQRLAGHRAVVRRLAAVEALGRVDIVCTDKTGTLTQGRLALSLVADATQEADLPGPLPRALRRVLLTAALASPHPAAAGARAHPTDVAVRRGAEDAGLGTSLRAPRQAESPFDPLRAFHATLVQGRLCVKGAPEVLLARCAPAHAADAAELLTRARQLAERGLRVLVVAEGPADQPPDAPEQLRPLGMVGLSDPLRPRVAEAVRRCGAAGVRVIMLTGDHPATARTIAQAAGVLDETRGDLVLTGADLAELHDTELDERLEHATVIARATPLDKLRIVESLRRRGHAVAMTGDGVNDAPALRLADVGVAMGRGGTEVARQAADLVLLDDNFATLVEAFVEGRSFWRNIRRSLGLLIGGNLGEMSLMVGASVLGLADPLTVRQILVVNMLTDILPALAIALQQPESRQLARLVREGEAALDRPLRSDILRRAALTALPSLGAYALARRTGDQMQAGTIAFASIVTTQLAQTLDAGWSEGRLTVPVVAAVGASLGMLSLAVLAPPLRGFLQLALPSPRSLLLIGGAAAASMSLSRLVSVAGLATVSLAEPDRRARLLGRLPRPVRPARPRLRLLPAPAGTA